MVPHERSPPLVLVPARFARFQILTHRLRRNKDAQLETQFIGDLFFTPDWVLTSHLPDQFPHILWQCWTPTLSRLSSPKHLECRSVPFDKRLGFDHDERVVPVEKLGECDHRQASSARCWTRLRFALLKQCKLFSQEQIFSDQSCPRRNEETKKREQARILLSSDV